MIKQRSSGSHDTFIQVATSERHINSWDHPIWTTQVAPGQRRLFCSVRLSCSVEGGAPSTNLGPLDPILSSGDVGFGSFSISRLWWLLLEWTKTCFGSLGTVIFRPKAIYLEIIIVYPPESCRIVIFLAILQDIETGQHWETRSSASLIWAIRIFSEQNKLLTQTAWRIWL